MKIKERLDLVKSQEQYVQKSISDLNKIKIDFEAEYLIKSYLNNHKNIIIISSVYLDKNLLTDYIKNLMDDKEKISVVNDLRYISKTLADSKKFVYNSDIKKALKVFEYILNGYGDFIFSMSVGTYENIIESLKTLLALNASNVNSEGINNLLGLSNAVIVFFDKGKDSLISIKNIGEIEYFSGNIELKNIFFDEKTTDYDSQLQGTENVQLNTYSDTAVSSSDINHSTTEIETENESDIKINKYKILKEKIKSKHHTKI